MDQKPASLQATSSSLHMSDVIEVLQSTEPDFDQQQDPRIMFNSPVVMDSKRQAWVKIVEQPASKALRFRYECEGRSAGSIPGANSTPENKTFPTIQVCGYQGRAVVVVSCVTKDAPYRPHPHNLVGKEGCKKGVCTMEITGEAMTATFSNLGIQCVKKKDIDEALRIREEIRVDPFHTGFSHRSQPTSIDLNAVRLCFQVFLEGAEKNKFTYMLPAVVSDPIYDKKAMSDLVICKLSDCSASVAGGRDIILLCEKVAKEDIQVRFFTEEEGQITWEGFAEFTPASVHKQVAISFRTPRYRHIDVDRPVSAFIQLRRPSDGAVSEALPFTFTPLDSDPRRKKPKQLLPIRSFAADSSQPSIIRSQFADAVQHSQPPLLQVKREPTLETSNIGGSFMYNVTSPVYVASPSPQHMKPSTSPHMGRTPSPMEHTPQQWAYQDAAAARLTNQPQQQSQPQPPSLRPPPTSSSSSSSSQAPAQQQPQQPLSPSSTPEFLPHQYLTLGPTAAYSIPISSFNMTPQPSMLNLGGGSGVQISAQSTTSAGQSDIRFTTSNTSSVLPTSRSLGIVDGAFLDMARKLPPMHVPVSVPFTETGSSILDLDSKQLGQLDSSDLAQLDLLESNLSANLSLGSEERRADMSDSLTRLTNSTLQELCDLNNMYNRDSPGN